MTDRYTYNTENLTGQYDAWWMGRGDFKQEKRLLKK